MAWGGEKEQQEEIAKGNLDAKNWQAEARKVVEDMVCRVQSNCHDVSNEIRWRRTTAPTRLGRQRQRQRQRQRLRQRHHQHRLLMPLMTNTIV